MNKYYSKRRHCKEHTECWNAIAILNSYNFTLLVSIYYQFRILWDVEKALGYWLIHHLLFYVPLKNISLIWRHHHYRWWAAKFGPMIGTQGLWAGRDFYRATLSLTQNLSFISLSSKELPYQVASYYSHKDAEDLFHGTVFGFFRLFYSFHNFLDFNFVGLSTTDETW
jgi:hypothetical protein